MLNKNGFFKNQIIKYDLYAIVGLILAAALLYFPSLLGYVTDFRDMSRLSFASCAFWRESVLQLEFPLWNPGIYLGQPTFFSPIGVFYPGNLLLLLGPAQYSIPIFWFLHCVLGGIGGYTVARQLNCRPSTACLSGLVWIIGGYTISMWSDGEKVLSGGWMPWVVVSLIQLFQAKKVICNALLGTVVSMSMLISVGDPSLLLHCFLLGIPIAVVVSNRSFDVLSILKQFVFKLFLPLGFSFLICAPILLPQLLSVDETTRADGIERADAEIWSLHPVRLLELAAPFALGDTLNTENYPGAKFVAEPNMPITPWAQTLYCGIALLLLAPFAGKKRLTYVLWGIIVFSVVLALGRYTPVNHFFRSIFSPYSYVRFPEKNMLVAISALGLLSALGAQNLLNKTRHVFLIPVALVILLATFLAAPSELNTPVLNGLLQSGVVSCFIIGLVFIISRHPKFTVLLPVVVAVDLLLAGMPAFKWVDAQKLTEPNIIAETIKQNTKGHQLPRLYRTRMVPGKIKFLTPNTGVQRGVAHVPSYGPTSSRLLYQLWDQMASSGDAVVKLLDINWVSLPKGSTPKNMTPVFAVEDVQFLKTNQNQRVHLVTDVKILDENKALKQITNGQLNPDTQAIVTNGSADWKLDYHLNGQGRHALKGSCAITEFHPEAVSVFCQSNQNALMVLNEQYWKGWTAKRNGETVPILRTNLVMRGVPISKGQNTITFQFKMPGLKVGCIISAAALLVFLLLLLFQFKKIDNTKTAKSKKR